MGLSGIWGRGEIIEIEVVRVGGDFRNYLGGYYCFIENDNYYFDSSVFYVLGVYVRERC